MAVHRWWTGWVMSAGLSGNTPYGDIVLLHLSQDKWQTGCLFFFFQHQLASFISLAMVPEMFSVQKLCMGYVHAFPAWIMFVHIEQFLLEVYFCVKTCLSIQRQKCYAKNKGIQSGFKACSSYWAQNTHRRINETCPFPWTSAERERVLCIIINAMHTLCILPPWWSVCLRRVSVSLCPFS